MLVLGCWPVCKTASLGWKSNAQCPFPVIEMNARHQVDTVQICGVWSAWVIISCDGEGADYLESPVYPLSSPSLALLVDPEDPATIQGLHLSHPLPSVAPVSVSGYRNYLDF